MSLYFVVDTQALMVSNVAKARRESLVVIGIGFLLCILAKIIGGRAIGNLLNETEELSPESSISTP